MQSDVNPFSTKFWIPGVFPYEFDEVGLDLGELVRRASRSPIVQIVGPHGSGKSTLLESLAEYYRSRGTRVCRTMLNDRQRDLPETFVPKDDDSRTVFLLDGYEQLSFPDRLRLRGRSWSKTVGLLWTTHRPAWRIPVLYRTEARYERFAAMVRMLSKKPSFALDDEFLRALFARGGKNFRTAFFELFDLASEAGEVASGTWKFRET